MKSVALDSPDQDLPSCPQCGWELSVAVDMQIEFCPRCGARLGLRGVSREEEVFNQVRDLDEDKRSQLLNEACSDDAELLRRVGALLSADLARDSMLDLEDTLPEAQLPNTSKSTGDRIGNYKLLQKIGEGGMGAVYMAEQTQPVKRTVALKVIRAGLDSRQVVARFEAERQSLALMDHPNIAKVLDAGATERGEPYFVMELVRGVPIKEYCDTNRLSTADRVRLMVDVCSAVQHAHQKGIIHRDLKPSNILVAQYDDRAVPKVIDFGVAKATHQKLTEKTLYTQLGQIVGTLEYMSPEQAVLNQLDVDTRTDVYSLGVILYELLVGETPLNSKKLRKRGLDQILREIRDQEPPRPSVRLSSQGKAAAQTAAYRQTDISTLARTLRGDLDWVVMQALEKNRKRRYDSASRLGEDLSNHLAGNAVDARPPTVAYLASKHIKRHQVPIAVTSLVLIALLSGLVGIIWQAEVANQRAERLAEEIDAKNRILRSLAESRYAEAVLAGLSWNDELAQDALTAADQLGASESSLSIVRALLAQNRGDYDRAIEYCDQVLNSDSADESERIAAKSLLLPASAFSFDWSRSELVKQELQLELTSHNLVENVTEVDRLLVAHALTIINPQLALDLLESTESMQKTPAGLFVEALSNFYIAHDTNDYEGLIAVVTDLGYVSRFALDNRAPRAWQLFCLTHALKAAGRDQRFDDATHFGELGRQLAQGLEVVDYPWGDFCRWIFFRAIDDTEAANDAFREMVSNGNEFHVYLRTESLVARNYEVIRQQFSQEIEAADASLPIIRIVDAHVAFSRRNNAAVRSLVQDIATESELIWHTRLAIATLCLVEVPSDINKMAQDALKRLPETRDMWGGLECLEFLADGDASKLMDATQGHQIKQMDAHFVIAMYRLAEKRPQLARESFQKCVDTDGFGSYDYELARSYVKRWELDPRWLDDLTEQRNTAMRDD